MSQKSFWSEFRLPEFAPVGNAAHFDVLVVGGGITGLTCALLLKQAGKRVCVLERGRIGSGESAHTSAHLTYVTDLRVTTLTKRFGEDEAGLVWKGGDAAIDEIERLARSLQIDCGFQRVPGYLYASPEHDSDEADELQYEQQRAASLGFPAEFLAHGPIAERPAVRYPNQAIFHPLRYIAGLAQAVHGDGSAVFEMSEAQEFADDPLLVISNGYRLTCDQIVIATHVPLTGIKGTLSAALFQTKLYPYSSYVLHAVVPSDAIAPGLYSDTADPYYYLRVYDADGKRHAIFGGRDHKTGQATDTDECFLQLEAYFIALFPVAEVTHRWSGQVVETSDGLPYIGEVAPRQFIATGYSGNGLTFGTHAAMIIRDAIVGAPNVWRELYDPSRKKLLSGLGNVIAESVDYPLYLVGDRLRRHEKDVASIARGDGKVLSIDGQHVAAHRKHDGSIVAVSAVCTHLGCLVRWNQGEETWDCPCHGSRFGPNGEVIGGPAEEPLARVDIATVSKA